MPERYRRSARRRRRELIVMFMLPEGDRIAVEVVDAVHRGDLETLARLLSENPGLASVRLADHAAYLGAGGVTRTLLHVATAWPHRVQAYLTAEPPPDTHAITVAFRGACHGDQQHIAEQLLEHGADLNWIGRDQLTPLDEALRSHANRLAGWLRGKGALTAAALRDQG